jgi:hypothetical protein
MTDTQIAFVRRAICALGANKVATALGVSREGALSIVAGIARAGTTALALSNLPRLERLFEVV